MQKGPQLGERRGERRKRPDMRCAHFLYWADAGLRSACASISRIEEYVPQRLRPRQSDNPRCLACESRLELSTEKRAARNLNRSYLQGRQPGDCKEQRRTEPDAV